MSSNMLKNWQETACTVTNTAEKKIYTCLVEFMRKEYRQGEGTWLYNRHLKVFYLFLINSKNATNRKTEDSK